MEYPLVSIIIPIYNAERFLAATLDSVLAQTYKNWELILIDDGSTDQSGALCDQYAAQHPEQVSVIHQRNQGVSVARNIGMDMARGEYIAFVDADDLITPEYLQLLCSRQQETNADLVGIGSNWLEPSMKNVIHKIHFCDDVCDSEKFHIFLKKHWQFFDMVWGKLFRKSIIDKHGLEFCREITLAEDNLFNCCYVSVCNKIASMKDVAYYYCWGHDSLSQKARSYWLAVTIRKAEEYRRFAKSQRLRTVFSDEVPQLWYYFIIRSIIDHPYRFSEMRENMNLLFRDANFCSYVRNIERVNFTRLERLYMYIMSTYPHQVCALLFFTIHRIKTPLNFIRLMLRRKNSKV